MRRLLALMIVPIALILDLLALFVPPAGGEKSALPVYLQEIHVNARQSEFQPREIRVRAGTRVKIVVYNQDVDHGLTLPALNLTALRTAPRKAVLEFTPQQTGKYEFRCNIQCGLGHDRMVGTLIVE